MNRCEGAGRMARFGAAIVAIIATAALARAESATGVIGRRVTALPATVIGQILGEPPSASARFFASEVELDDRAPPELLIYVVGQYWCGTGGCTLFVFGADEDRHREIARIPTSRPPVRIAATTSHGWRSLIVGVGGGGEKAGDVELTFDGTTYAGESSGRARRVSSAELASAVTVIGRFESWSEGTELVAPAQ